MTEQDLSVLSIDDRFFTSDLDRANFKKMGVHIKMVGSFQAAQEYLENENISIIVINHDFKNVDSLQLCNHFKSLENTKNIPIVVTSVRSKPGDFKRLTAAGVDLFIEQPMPRQYFVERLKTLLDQRTRVNDRLKYEGVAEFMIDGNPISANIGDLSSTGLLLLTKDLLPLEVKVNVGFSLPSYKKPIKVKGTIVRDIMKKNGEDRLGYGIRFDEFVGDSEKRLVKYLTKLNKGDPKLIYYL